MIQNSGVIVWNSKNNQTKNDNNQTKNEFVVGIIELLLSSHLMKEYI